MRLTRRNWITLACGFAGTVFAGQASARGSIVKVTLRDQGAAAMNMLGQGEMRGMGTGTDKAGSKMPMAPMEVRVSSHTVRAGEVTFEVTNSSRQLVHEMVISPVKDTKTPLPYDKARNAVDEDAAGHLGEVSELAPGKKGALRLTLKPGTYILYCNVPGHYALGMWTLLTVKA
jgi:uncharacterized cupredoxin-like copper-binding protein